MVRFCEDFVNRKLGPFGPFPSEVLAFLLFTPFSLAVLRITAQPLPSLLLVKVYVVISFIAALFWINVVADELVALLATLGDILKLNHAILGLTGKLASGIPDSPAIEFCDLLMQYWDAEILWQT